MRAKNTVSVTVKSPAFQDELLLDAMNFFTGNRQGHMGKWEYGPSLFAGDPAGGGEQWARLVGNPGHYYLTEADIKTIKWATQQEQLRALLSDVKSVIELGPGSNQAIINKTIPFLSACPQLKKYIAIDATLEQATEAARLVRCHKHIAVGVSDQDFTAGSYDRFSTDKSAIVMWGGSLGNIEGCLGDDPFDKLVSALKTFLTSIKPKDVLMICFDTQSNEEAILKAYSEPDLRASVLSTLYRLKRDGYVSGKFDPRAWSHEARWIPETQQCAHTVYPLIDQAVHIDGKIIEIPAWQRLVANNSYKFLPAKVISAAYKAGFKSAFCLQAGPIALLVSTGKEI